MRVIDHHKLKLSWIQLINGFSLLTRNIINCKLSVFVPPFSQLNYLADHKWFCHIPTIIVFLIHHFFQQQKKVIAKSNHVHLPQDQQIQMIVPNLVMVVYIMEIVDVMINPMQLVVTILMVQHFCEAAIVGDNDKNTVLDQVDCKKRESTDNSTAEKNEDCDLFMKGCVAKYDKGCISLAQRKCNQQQGRTTNMFKFQSWKKCNIYSEM